MERILAWDFERVILSHGDIIVRDAKQVVAGAWRQILSEGCGEARPGPDRNKSTDE